MTIASKVARLKAMSYSGVKQKLLYHFRRYLYYIRISFSPASFFIARPVTAKFRISRNWISYKLYSGTYDTDEINILAAMLHKESLFIDAGANIGVYAVELAFRTGCNVLAFEPSQRELDDLIANAELNNLETIQPFNIALGEQEGDALFYVEAQNNGINSFEPGMTGSHTVHIKIESLDKIGERVDFRGLKAIKIDVEGFELAVLKGAEGTIRKYRPAILYESLNIKGTKGFALNDNCEASNFLSKMGYTFYEIQRGKLTEVTDSTVINSSNFFALQNHTVLNPSLYTLPRNRLMT